MGFWVGYNNSPREDVLLIERFATLDALPETESSTLVESVVVSTTTANSGGSTMSGTSYPKPSPLAGAALLPADKSTETVNMGEYLVRYNKEDPKVLQVLYPHDGTPFVTQEIEWEFPAQIINKTDRNGYDERVLVGRDFNYDGYMDIGLLVWFYRGHNKYHLFTFNPATFSLQRLVVEGVNESFSSPTFNVKNRTITLHDGQPDISVLVPTEVLCRATAKPPTVLMEKSTLMLVLRCQILLCSSYLPIESRLMLWAILR